MARPDAEIDDGSPLAGARIDIGARIGWLLRSSRTASGATLRDLAHRIPGPDGRALSAPTLSRVETGGRRSGHVVAGYEDALGLPYGQLRAAIDVLCRTFEYAPADVDPFLPPDDLAAFSATCAAVADQPTGHDWLRFAEHHARGRFGLPEHLAAPLVARLADEVGRSMGLGYRVRYEALATLRTSAYGDLVEDAVRAAVAVPGTQRPSDLLSAVTELPTPRLVAWCGELLTHPSWLVARAGCLGLQNMRSVGGLADDDWVPLAPSFAAACEQGRGDPLREPILSSTLAACPPHFRAAVRVLLAHAPASPRRPAGWSRSRVNVHFGVATSLAGQVGAAPASEAMLTRLLFEVLYDFRATHTVTSSFLLAASPYADRVRELLRTTALDGPDEVTRHGAAGAFTNLMLPFQQADPGPWLASDDPAIRSAGLTICAFAGVPLDAGLLHSLVREGGQATRDALFAAGMAEQSELAAVADDPALPDDVRAGAQWWRTAGGRIVS